MNRRLIARIVALLVALSIAFPAVAGILGGAVTITTTPAALGPSFGYTGATHVQNVGSQVIYLVTMAAESDPAPSAAACVTNGFQLPPNSPVAKIDPVNAVDPARIYACTGSGSSTLILWPQ